MLRPQVRLAPKLLGGLSPAIFRGARIGVPDLHISFPAPHVFWQALGLKPNHEAS